MVCFPDGCLLAKNYFCITTVSLAACLQPVFKTINMFQAVWLLFMHDTVYTDYSIQQVIGSKRGNSDDGGMSGGKIEIT